MKRQRMLTQTRVKGERKEQLGAGVIKEIKHRVESISIRYNVSKSYVIAVALADAFGITKQERYETHTKVRRIS